MDLEQVTLTQLRYAVAIEESGSFRRAADACHVSQSGLSMQLRKLEELLGLVLFDRSKKPVLVTPAGERALAQMRAVLRDIERLGQIVVEAEEPSGRFRLGVIPTLSSTVMPLFLGAFSRAHPKVELVVEELKTQDIIARLRGDTLDAGLAATPLGIAGLTELPLGKEPMYAYLPPHDPLAKKATVTQAELKGRALWVMPEGHCFRSQVLAYCGGQAPERPLSIQFESGSFQTLVRLVDEGLGATVLPELALAELSPERRRNQVRPLVSPVPVREIGLVVSRTDLRRRVTTALEASIRAALKTALSAPPRRAKTLDPLA